MHDHQFNPDSIRYSETQIPFAKKFPCIIADLKSLTFNVIFFLIVWDSSG
jgi:hypothetical protein